MDESREGPLISPEEDKGKPQEPPLINPSDIEGLSPDQVALLQSADAKLYAKNREVVTYTIPSAEELQSAEIPSPEVVRNRLLVLDDFLHFIAIKDKFGTDHLSRRKWREDSVSVAIPADKVQSSAMSYEPIRPSWYNEMIDNKDISPSQLPPLPSKERIIEIARIDLGEAMTPAKLRELQDELEETAVLTADDRYYGEQLCKTVRSAMFDREKLDLINKTYEDVNQFRANRMSPIAMDIQLLSRLFFKANNSEMHGYLRDQASKLHHLIDQHAPSHNYREMDYPDKVAVIRTFEDTIMEVIDRVLPEQLKTSDRQQRIKIT